MQKEDKWAQVSGKVQVIVRHLDLLPFAKDSLTPKSHQTYGQGKVEFVGSYIYLGPILSA